MAQKASLQEQEEPRQQPALQQEQQQHQQQPEQERRAPGGADDTAVVEEEDAYLDGQFLAMVKPLLADTFLIVALVCFFELGPRGSAPFENLLPAGTSKKTTAREGAAVGALNALAITAIGVVFSYGFALLYLAYSRRGMTLLALVSFALPTATLTAHCVQKLSSRLNFNIDIITTVLVAVNVGGFFAWAVVYSKEHRRRNLANRALVLICVSLAWPFLCVDEWTVWLSLLFLVVWDVWAVYYKFGAIAIVLGTKQRRAWLAEPNELPQGLVYETDSGFALGTGDFILYGVLLGRAAMRGVPSFAAAALGVLLGLFATVWWAYQQQGNLSVPALPPVLILGMLAYFATHFAVEPTLATLAEAHVFI